MHLEYNIYFEFTAAMFLLVMAVYMRMQYNMKLDRNRIFFNMTMTVFLADFMDVLTAMTISYCYLVPVWLNIGLNMLYFLINGIMGFRFVRYSIMVNEKKFEHSIHEILCYSIIAVYAVFLFVNVFTNWIFYFDANRIYTRGPLYFIVYLVPYTYFIYSFYFMLRFIPKANWKQKISIIMYAVISLSGMMLQLFVFQNVLLNWFTISLAVVVLQFALETPEYEQLMQTMEHLKRAETKANVANDAKSRFLANMSHEIRTPINAILGMDEMILRQSHDIEVIEYANNIATAGNTLLSIVNDILDFSKIESGKMEIVPTEYEIVELVRNCEKMVLTRAEAKKLEFIVKCDVKLPRKLYGDEIRIQQILTNLLTNAVKYTEEGSITLRLKGTYTQEDELRLIASVEDTGKGISEENQKLLFGSFERIDEKSNRNIEGTGLGLAISKQLVELMHGEIGLYSEPGKGSLFYVEIPQKIVDATPVGEWKASNEKNKKRKVDQAILFAPDARILVVDDVDMNLKVMTALLKRTEISFDTVNSGEEALVMLRREHYDMMFLDDMMPGMDGRETLQRFLEMADNPNKGIPVIALTANAVSGAYEEYMEAGFTDYVSKPATGKRLEEVILQYLPEDLIRKENEDE